MLSIIKIPLKFEEFNLFLTRCAKKDCFIEKLNQNLRNQTDVPVNESERGTANKSYIKR